ncbi:hypothetical protein GBAR_LOCUS781 [Geodia barretti]|uniref:Uncharacterized protein n=1 Tax=Geodia barretti TaxID=519541 RepID=A0AA35QTL6_GEOBA|nr:hypothetical protein GBAR_LOCUS781 [Geodia barretti]
MTSWMVLASKALLWLSIRSMHTAQIIGTSGTVETFTPAVHEYLHALVTVAHPPPLQMPTSQTSISHKKPSSNTSISPSLVTVTSKPSSSNPPQSSLSKSHKSNPPKSSPSFSNTPNYPRLSLFSPNRSHPSHPFSTLLNHPHLSLPPPTLLNHPHLCLPPPTLLNHPHLCLPPPTLLNHLHPSEVKT